MAEEPEKDCLLACDAAGGPVLCQLRLPATACVQAALVQARLQLQEAGMDALIDWQGAVTGIWGVRCERSAVPRDGDRIELYRPLLLDPRDRRRRRAGAARRE